MHRTSLVWLGRLIHLLREAQSHWPPFWFHSQGPRVVVSTAAFHATVRGSVPGLGGLKEAKMFLPHLPFTPEFGAWFSVSAVWKKQKMFLPHPRVKVSIVGSLRDREVACSASDRQGSNFESCVWRSVSSESSHHPQEVLLAQFSLYVHKCGLKPDSFHFHSQRCKNDTRAAYQKTGMPWNWD